MRLSKSISELKVVQYHYPLKEKKEYFIKCREEGDATTLINFICSKCQLPVAYYLPRDAKIFALTKNVGFIVKT